MTPAYGDLARLYVRRLAARIADGERMVITGAVVSPANFDLDPGDENQP